MIVQADARRIPLADESVHCCISSPPYWGLRDYGLATWEGGDAECQHDVGGQVQDNKAPGAIISGVRPGAPNICRKCGAVRHDAGIGLEATPEEYVANIVEVFREVWRVLRPDATLWLNMGDCYAGTGYGKGTGGNASISHPVNKRIEKPRFDVPKGLKSKDLIGMPWRVAFALQADGWYLRSDIIWHKPNPMPESVRDRPTKAHEYLFLLSKQPRYYYDSAAIAEASVTPGDNRAERTDRTQIEGRNGSDSRKRTGNPTGATRNRRDVWTIPTAPYRGAHFATFPPALVEPCILAGCPPNGIALDPFCGSGTVGQVCRLHGRRFVGLDLSMKYLRELALPRAEGTQAAGANDDLPMFGVTHAP